LIFVTVVNEMSKFTFFIEPTNIVCDYLSIRLDLPAMFRTRIRFDISTTEEKGGDESVRVGEVAENLVKAWGRITCEVRKWIDG
jgi:hypothetical protein